VNRLVAAISLVAAAFSGDSGAASPGWPQWGGPARNFVVAAPGLASTWPADGPRRLWRRPLGDGFSAIVTDGTTLYTLYRDGSQDVAAALDAATGTTRWESRYDAPFNDTCSQQLGPAPRASPLIDGDRVITASAGGLLNAFDRRTGARLWTYDLVAGTPDAVRACGYSSSPMAFEGRIITTAGGSRRGVVSLDAATGRVAWQTQDFDNGYSSPLLIDLDGKPEVVVFTFGDVAGLDPRTGALEWRFAHPAEFGVNVAMPVWGDDHLLFVSSAYNGGSRALRLTRQAGVVSVEERWSSKRIRVHFGNAVRLGSRVYASNGDFGAAPLAAIEIATGEIVWRDRTLSRSMLIGAGDRLILLDEDGTLALATPGDTGLAVHAKAPILESQTWTPPTLSGTTLYVRNRRDILALDLGNPANSR